MSQVWGCQLQWGTHLGNTLEQKGKGEREAQSEFEVDGW